METLRTGIVYAMRSGSTFCINIAKTAPDFRANYTHDKIFPTNEIFNWALWCSDDYYMKVVKEEEDHDLIGNKKMYEMRDKFQMCILATYHDDEQLVRVTKNIPHSEEFVRLIIDKLPEGSQMKQPSLAETSNKFAHLDVYA